MPEHAPPPAEHGATRHERSEFNAPGVVWFLVVMTVVILVAHLLLWGLVAWWTRPDVQPRTLQRGALPARELPAQPVLEGIAPPPTRQTRDQAARRRLQSYGWVEPGSRLVHIPIQRAMQLEAAQHQDEPAEHPHPDQPPVLVPPSSSNSGRTLRRSQP